MQTSFGWCINILCSTDVQGDVKLSETLRQIGEDLTEVGTFPRGSLQAAPHCPQVAVEY